MFGGIELDARFANVLLDQSPFGIHASFVFAVISVQPLYNVVQTGKPLFLYDCCQVLLLDNHRNLVLQLGTIHA